MIKVGISTPTTLLCKFCIKNSLGSTFTVIFPPSKPRNNENKVTSPEGKCISYQGLVWSSSALGVTF